MQRVFYACLNTLNHMIRSALGIPLIHDVACAVQYLEMCSGQLFACADVHLRYCCASCVSYVIAIHFTDVSVYRIFGDRVGDLLSDFAFFVLRKICKAPFPVVICGYGLRQISQLLTVCINADRDALRSCALVAAIGPGLGAFDIYSLRRVCIRQGRDNAYCLSRQNLFPFHRRCQKLFRLRIGQLIALRKSVLLLSPGVNILHTSGILRKIFYSVRPAVFFIQRYRCNHFAVLLQIDFEFCRTDAILVVCVVPLFPNGYVHQFRNVRVRQGRKGSVCLI